MEALELYFEAREESVIRNLDFDFVMDLQHFFQSNDYLNVSRLAERTGMNSSLLRQYTSGIKFPGIEQVSKIEKAINEIGLELANIQLVNKASTVAK